MIPETVAEQLFSAAIGVLVGGIITFLVSWRFFRRTSEETTNMLRTFAMTLEQLPLPVVFLRDENGEIDLSKPGRITAKAVAVLPSPRVSGQGSVT